MPADPDRFPRSASAPSGAAGDLRQQAEALLRSGAAFAVDPGSRLGHELAVQQIELKLQNDALLCAQAELQASHDRYRDLFDWAPVGYLTLSASGEILECNRRAGELLGRPAADLLGAIFTQFLRPGDRARLLLNQDSLQAGGQAQQFELPIVTAHESGTLWVSLQMTRMDASAGVETQYRVVLADIDERLRAQQDLTRMASIVESAEDAIVGRDLAGVVTSWNQAASRLFGTDAAAMLGHAMTRLVPADRGAEEAHLLRRLRAGEHVAPFDSERLSHDGTPLPLQLSLSPVRDELGDVVGSSLIARDIAERQRADRSLQERLRQLDVLSQAGQALIMGEQDTASMRRELFERMRLAVGAEICLNYSVGDTPNTLVLESSAGLPYDVVAQLLEVHLGATLCALAAQRESPLIVDHLLECPWPQAAALKAIGAQCYAGFPLQAHGRIYGVVSFACTSRDRYAEGDLKVIQTVCDQVSAILERRRLLDELHASEQSLKRADRAKDDFIATLAHELRNPLAPIRNAVTILRREDLADPATAEWCRAVIDRQVAQMTRLLDDLLDVSRLTRNRIELRREPFDLARALDLAVETTSPLIAARGHRLKVKPPLQPVVVDADLTRVTQVLANLLNNAAKYSDSGCEITVTVVEEDANAVITVRDEGIGIDARQLERVFDMFAQLAPSSERSVGGLGIGLSLARAIADMHGGSLTAASGGAGQGSQFLLRLPLAPRDAAPPAADPAESASTQSRRRVLVVDDNVDAARTMAAMLALHGHEVRSAFGGAEALELLRDWQPDAAVLDIGMPEMNGYELCRRIRASTNGEPPLMIACTGWGQPTDRARARRAGFDAHIVKPADSSELLRILAGGGLS